MDENRKKPIQNQFGLHYFQDTNHYRKQDLDNWLPVLKSLKVAWLVLKTERNRAIPEDFIRTLLENGITPIIEFNIPYRTTIGTRELKILLQAYAKWGIKYCVFFDKPNQKSSWSENNWAQNDLVERFLDQYSPLANYALAEGLLPVFPPLAPGGDYWDTSFLWSSIKSLIRREQKNLLDNLVLSAYSFTFNRSLNWGLGGQELWPDAKPYNTPQGTQDQLGFRIFDWYNSIARSLLQKEVPLILFKSGSSNDSSLENKTDEEIKKTWFDQKLISMLIHTQKSIEINGQPSIEPLPENILASNFWYLAADKDQENFQFAWFLNEKPQNQWIKEMISERQENPSQPTNSPEKNNKSRKSDKKQSLIKHYLLLPDQEHGISDWDFEKLKPLINIQKLTVGFSIDEAILSRKVTLLSGKGQYSDETIRILKKFGCEIEQLQ